MLGQKATSSDERIRRVNGGYDNLGIGEMNRSDKQARQGQDNPDSEIKTKTSRQSGLVTAELPVQFCPLSSG